MNPAAELPNLWQVGGDRLAEGLIFWEAFHWTGYLDEHGCGQTEKAHKHFNCVNQVKPFICNGAQVMQCMWIKKLILENKYEKGAWLKIESKWSLKQTYI